MKKIAFTIDTNTAGGGERVISLLANHFAEKDYQVYVINSDIDSHFYPLDTRVNNLKMGLARNDNNSKIKRIWRFIYKFWYLVQFMQKVKPDAVVTFLFNMEAPTILAGLLTKTRVFSSVRNSANAYPVRERSFRKRYYPRIAGVVFQSKSVRESSDFKNLKNAKVIMNPLSPVNIYEYSETEDKVRNNWIINVGRLTKQKNQALLIEAFASIHREYPELELHIFGDGDLKEELETLADSLGLKDKVAFEGVVDEAIYRYRNSKLFVMSSDYEGFPNALAEAMANCLPVICSKFDSGVAEELIHDGENGLLFTVGDKTELEEKIRWIIDNPTKAEIMAEEGSKIAHMLNTTTICKQWEKFIFNDL